MKTLSLWRHSVAESAIRLALIGHHVSMRDTRVEHPQDSLERRSTGVVHIGNTVPVKGTPRAFDRPLQTASLEADTARACQKLRIHSELIP
jgi:hypothetical protein